MRVKKRVKYRILTSEEIDGIIMGLILILEVCCSKTLVIMIPVLIVRYLILLKNLSGKFAINSSTLWLFLVFIITTINGMRLPNNESEFSFLYNMTTFACIILMQMLLLQYEGKILSIIEVAVIVSALVIGTYILTVEYNMLLYRWEDILTGNSGYRLGVSSNINPNTITWTFGILALFTIVFALSERKVFYFLLYVFELLIIFLTGSKNGLLLALIPIIVYGIDALKEINIRVIASIMIFVIIVWILIHSLSVLYTLIGKRIDSMLYTIGLSNNIKTITAGIDMSSTEKRIRMIVAAAEMFWEKPILGWGIGAFARTAGFGYYCHNNYMEILVSSGILVFIIYYVYLGICFFKALYMKKCKKKDIAIMLFLSLALLDFSTVNFYSNVIFYVRTILMLEIVTWHRNAERTSDYIYAES